MVKDILREWRLRPKWVIFFNLIIDIIFCISFHLLTWSWSICKMTGMFGRISDSQINALIPMDDADKKRRIVLQVFMISIFYTGLFTVGLIIFFCTRNREVFGNVRLIFLNILWVILYFVQGLDSGISTEKRIFSGKGSEARADKKEWIIFIFSSALNLIIFFGTFYSYRLAVLLRIAQADAFIGIIVLMILLLIADICYSIKEFHIGDWTE